MKKTAIILFNLGGPLESKDVKGFLYNLFNDPNIIGLPFGLRQAVAKLISTRREKSAQANYNHMGGGSPLLRETKAQAEALQAELNGVYGAGKTKCFIAMRYWHPFMEETLAEVEAYAPDEIVLLPLYPQFSKTTTYSSKQSFDALYKGKANVKMVCCYPTNQSFITAHAEQLKSVLGEIDDKETYRILFSAHGLPESIIKSGDPYQSQVEATVASIMKNLGDGFDYTICYQSRVGPLKWIGPSTEETIKKTATDNKNIILVPVAFVSEHIETLVELDIEYAELAHELGIKHYKRVTALGVNKNYILALIQEIKAVISDTSCIYSGHSCANKFKYCPKIMAASKTPATKR
jgi:protoporphyrin/coproporphyrin ferrochelatase